MWVRLFTSVPNLVGRLSNGLIAAIMQIAKFGLEPEFDPEPDHLGEADLMVAAHGRSSGNVAEVFVAAKAL